jgi:hypothetical protein
LEFFMTIRTAMFPTFSDRPTSLTRHLATALSLTAFSLVAVTGCSKPLTDAQLSTNVQAALTADASINQQPIQISVQSGVVSLTGNVSDDTARSVATEDAAHVKGIKEVVNNLTVAGIAVTPTVTAPSQPNYARPVTAQERQQIATQGTLAPPSESAPPPPEPVFRNVTLPAGADIPVRINQSLDSETTQSGATFSGVVTREVVADGLVVIPVGATVRGTVVDAEDATHFKGSSRLSIELTGLTRHRDALAISTDPYTVEGKGRGTNTAEKIGGGAAIGAVIGGIFGGGKGAAIGAGAGAGGGTILQGSTRGQQVRIPAETLIRFHLSAPLTVKTRQQPSEDQPTGLQTR